MAIAWEAVDFTVAAFTDYMVVDALVATVAIAVEFTELPADYGRWNNGRTSGYSLTSVYAKPIATETSVIRTCVIQAVDDGALVDSFLHALRPFADCRGVPTVRELKADRKTP